MKCNFCFKEVNRIFKGKTRSDGRRIYFDHTGREWTGMKCPDCRYSNKRYVGKSVKLCSCGKPMPATRYYKCEECKPFLAKDVGDFIYS